MSETFIGIVILIIWVESLYFRIFDKKLKRYVVMIGILNILLSSFKLIRGFIDYNDNHIFWYLYYLPLLFIPVIYSMAVNYLVNPNIKIQNYIYISISSFFLILVLTNNIHSLVFKINTATDYSYTIIYYLIYLWMFYLFVKPAIQILRYKRALNDKRNIIYLFLPIILGITYTVLYMNNRLENIIFLKNVAFIDGILYLLGIESIMKLDFIPNNGNYLKAYYTSKTKGAFVSDTGEIFFKVSDEMEIPTVIIEDIKRNKVLSEYKFNKNNHLYKIKKIYDSYFIIFKDYTGINNLKDEIKNKNQELNEQNELLKKTKKIREEYYKKETRKRILKDFDSIVSEKREVINKLLDEIDDSNYKESLYKMYIIKLYITYLKRMSYLVTSSYDNKVYYKEDLDLIMQELFKYCGELNIDGILIVDDNIKVESISMIKLYETIFNIIKDSTDINVIINIKKEKLLHLRIRADKKIENLNKKLENMSFYDVKVKEREDSFMADVMIGGDNL